MQCRLSQRVWHFARPSLAGLLAGLALHTLAAPGVAAQESPSIRLPCGAQIHANEATGFRVLPQDETFCRLIADPKEPRSFLAFQRGEFGTLDQPDVDATSIGAVGLADAFGLLRWGGSQPGDGFHLALAGAIFAQFDLGTPSIDLINADYLVGLPLTWRRGRLSTRVRLYHQSSHLGDEYVLRGTEIERENLSFESVEVIASVETRLLRAYGGGEHLFRREPDSVERFLAHGGLELRTLSAGPLSILAGIDLKLSEQHDWSPAMSARAGVQLAPPPRGGHPARRILILAEFYNGPSPYGQFFLDEIRYAGLGIHLLH